MTFHRLISHVILFGVAALTVAFIRLPWDQLTTPLPVPIIVSGISTPEPYTSDHSAHLLRLAPPDTTSITRVTDLHTDKPNATRPTVITYTIVVGDTPFSIANRFGLKPETILWGNPLLTENAEALICGHTTLTTARTL